MPKKIFGWVKTHKLLAFNLVVVLFVLLSLSKRFLYLSTVGISRQISDDYVAESRSGMLNVPTVPIAGSIDYSEDGQSGNTRNSVSNTQKERKVITNSNLSLLVKDVDVTVENIRNKVSGMGGFMVNTNIRRDAEASSSTIEVRVPSDQLVEFSKYLRTLSVKVVYENIMGFDITDQYVDYEERLRSLEAIKERFQEIMDKAETVDEIMNVQNRILNIQSQIDSIKGQLTYMDRSTATSKVTITISTDELSLPYTPVKSWRPDVIAKNAVRSLISVLMALGTLMIWLVTFSPLIILFIALKVSIKYILKKRKNKKELVKNIK